MKTIRTSDLKRALQQRVRVLDVLSPRAYRSWHIPTAINLPLEDLDDVRLHGSGIDRTRPVIAYCYDYQ